MGLTRCTLNAGIALKLLVVLAWVGLSLTPSISQAQSAFAIVITEPAEGAQINGPFTLRGTTLVPLERQLALRITSTSTGERIIEQALPLAGEVGQQGTFSIVINYTVASATPALIQVLYFSAKDGSILARGEVRVVLRKYTAPGISASEDLSVAAIRFALDDYQARTQAVTPIPLSVEDTAFNDSCLGLVRPGESCIQGQVAGKRVRLSSGGQTFTYHVGNNQARLNEAEGAPVKPKGSSVPKLLAEASAVTGVTLYVPPKLSGPFQGLYFRRVDWDNGVVTISYGAENNPIDFRIVERAGTAVPAHPGGESIQIGTNTVPVQVADGRRSTTWVIQSTLITLSVPQSIGNADLATLANSFALLGSTLPGQINPQDKAQFTRLTLNLPEPVRSAEMAREALMALVKPPRQGVIIAVQAKQFSDSCLGLARQNEACPAAVTPGYVIGIADSELYRYHVAGSVVRLNRPNSELRNKRGVDYASLDAVRAAAPFVAAPADANLTLLGAEINPVNNAPEVLLLYRDGATGGVLALRETMSGALPNPATSGQTITISGQQVNVQSDSNGQTVVFVFQSGADRQVLVTLWASPEIGIDDVARLANSLTAQ
jgi:hypothetical protein